MLRNSLIALAAFIAIVAGYMLLWPIPINPVAVAIQPSPGFTGVFQPNEALRATKFLGDAMGTGPEDVTIHQGYAYTGLEDGRIVRVPLDGKQPMQVVANTGGRPLGLQFDPYGNIVVADAKRGLLAVTPDGRVQVLVDRINGTPVKFIDDLDIAADGTIYFSDASQRFGIAEYLLDILEGSATGRLLALDPRTMQVTVKLENLNFANGVALGPNENFVLVNETGASRITRLWLKGEKAGQRDVFIENLPGYPDNISFDGRGLFWVALPGPRTKELDDLMPSPSMRRIVYRLMMIGLAPQPAPQHYGWVIAIDPSGKVVQNLQDPGGKTIHSITSVNSVDGTLYFGSLQTDRVATLPLAR